MTNQSIAIIGAGTRLSFENPASPGNFIELQEALTIGSIGEQGEFIETTPISSTTRTYVPGLKPHLIKR